MSGLLDETGVQTSASGHAAVVARLFESRRPQLKDNAAIRTLFEAFTARCGPAMSRLASIDTKVALEAVEQGPTTGLLDGEEEGVAVVGRVAEWNGNLAVRVNPRVLRALVDAMYGGSGVLDASAPLRPLTGLEKSLAIKLATVMTSELQWVLSDHCRFTFRGARHIEEPVSDALGEIAGNYVVLRFTMLGLHNALLLVLPKAGLEHASTRLGGTDRDALVDIDPDWSAQFKRSVTASGIEVTAVMHGWPMTVSDVARLSPGTLLEFSPDELERVRIESNGLLIYSGRLGQSRGHFTVRVDRAPRVAEAETTD